MNPISIMQGRLSPPFEGRFQAFPASTWQDEFYKAQKLGLYSIEWIYEKPHESENSFSTDLGIDELQRVIIDTGVLVKSICADYYMTEHLIRNGKAVPGNWGHLDWLYTQAKKINVTYIVLPFVDSSSLKTEEDRNALVEALKSFLSKNETLGIEVHLETDLQPHHFYQLIEAVNHPLLKMNYDMGNSASLGYDPDVEFDLMGKYLGSVHIKDRVLGGGTVSLGTGNTQFKKCFSWLKKLDFNRWLVLQVARGKEGEEAEHSMENKLFVKNLFKEILHENA